MSQTVLHISEQVNIGGQIDYFWVCDDTREAYKIVRWWVFNDMRKHRSKQEMSDEDIQIWADVSIADAFEYLDASGGLDYEFGIARINPELG